MAELRIDGEDTRTLKDILDEIKMCAFMLDNTSRCLIMEDIAEIQRRYGDGWISVDDALPDEWKQVITYQPTFDGIGLIRCGVYIGIKKWRETEYHNLMEL